MMQQIHIKHIFILFSPSEILHIATYVALPLLSTTFLFSTEQ